MNKAVVISGAGTGIGAATARLFSTHDYHVFLLGRREERLQAVAAELAGPSTAISADLNSASSCERAVLKIREVPGLEIKALINNAGIFEREDFEKSSDELWQEQLSCNLIGLARLSRLLLPDLRKASPASITHVSSTLGLRPVPGTSVYSAVKAAVVNLTQSMAVELAPEIRVNCVCPGLVDTPLHVFHHLGPEEKQKTLGELAEMQPLGRVGHPDEVAESLYFLASERSCWTTGAILSVDGGINLK